MRISDKASRGSPVRVSFLLPLSWSQGCLSTGSSIAKETSFLSGACGGSLALQGKSHLTFSVEALPLTCLYGWHEALGVSQTKVSSEF